MKNTFFILILGILFVSCNKERTFHIKAINAVTGQAYAGLAYSVTATKTAANGEKLVYDHKGFLDANGEAYVTLKVKTGRTYNIGCTEPPNTCYVKNINFTYGQEDEVNPTFQFEYAECGFLRERITNVNCLGPSDYMILHTSNQVNSLGVTGWEFFGCNGYYTENYSQVPIGKYYHKWTVTKNNITTTFYDTINLNENEYLSFDVDY
jgi:hypothetical protein